jgi:hypothetical protein
MKNNYDSPSTPGNGGSAGGVTAIPQGSIKASLVALPFWYQLLSIILSALIPFFLNDFALLSWASHELHFDFGTSTLWTSSRGSRTYFNMVNSMSIRERLGFAVYATFVLGVVWLVTRSVYPTSIRQPLQPLTSSKVHYSKSSSTKPLSRSDLNDSRFETSSATLRLMDQCLLFPKFPKLEKLFLVLNVVEALLMVKHIITECVESPQFATFIASSHIPGGVGNVSPTYEAVRFVLYTVNLDAHAHVLVQLDIVLRLLTWWMKSVFVPAALVFVYRMMRDARSRHVHSQRWYALCLMVARSTLVIVPLLFNTGSQWEAYGAAVSHFISGDSSQLSSIWKYPLVWSEFMTILRGLWLVAAVNYVYGPSRRSTVVTTETSRRVFFVSSVKTMFRSTLVPLIASLLVLGFAVGVHIVELLLLWIFTFLALIWIPTALDSGSQELMCFLSLIAACVNEVAPSSALVGENSETKFFLNTDYVTFFFASLLFLVAISTLFNVGCVVFGSRSASLTVFTLSVLLCIVGLTYSMTITYEDIAAPLLYMTKWLPQAVLDATSRVVLPSLPEAFSTPVTALSVTKRTWIISGGFLTLTIACSFVNTFLDRRSFNLRLRQQCQSGMEPSSSWSRGSTSGKYVVCTAVLLCKRFLWLIAQLVNVTASVTCGVVFCHICSALHFPLDTETWLAVCIGIACFGAMTDLTPHEYQFLLRVVGFTDPPLTAASERSSSGLNDDSSEIAEGQ